MGCLGGLIRLAFYAFLVVCIIVGAMQLWASIPALLIAPLIAAAPNFVAGTVDSDPPKLPIGVRTADTIYTSLLMMILLILICTKLIKTKDKFDPVD